MSEVKLLPLPDALVEDLIDYADRELKGRPTRPQIQRRIADYARANMEPLLAEIEALRAEVERLRQAVADNITDSTMLRHMNVIDGGLHLGLEGGGAQLLAETFAHQFMESGALNFLEVAFTHEKLGKVIVTLQRVDGLTPADKTKAAEARAERLAEALRIAYRHLDMASMRVSHCKDAAVIESALHPTAAQEDRDE